MESGVAGGDCWKNVLTQRLLLEEKVTDEGECSIG